MVIYTSYFNAKLPNDVLKIGIAQNPMYFEGPSLAALAPTTEMRQAYKAGDKEYYVSEFKKMLSFLNADAIINEALAITGGGNAALCCHEKPTLFCHRHLVSEWMRGNGYNVYEFTDTIHKQNRQYEQVNGVYALKI